MNRQEMEDRIVGLEQRLTLITDEIARRTRHTGLPWLEWCDCDRENVPHRDSRDIPGQIRLLADTLGITLVYEEEQNIPGHWRRE